MQPHATARANGMQPRAACLQVVPAGTRRACFHAGMRYVSDKAHHAWLLEEASSSDDEYAQPAADKDKASDKSSDKVSEYTLAASRSIVLPADW